MVRHLLLLDAMPGSSEQPDADDGRQIGGRYRLEERIGRGGMATVYRAHDEQLDRAVAVKVMRADLGEDPLFVQRFEAEARRAASVSHPNVVLVYDVGTDGAPYMVMELVEGGDLARLIADEGRMSPERAAHLAADSAAALGAAHDAGLVHRDVKPGNILLGADGRAMVADFGIARATGEDSMTKTGATLGSVEYFSPEQARGERVGPASDIYALGCVLYELLTGQRPFRGDSAYAVATARLRQATPDPRTVVDDLPRELATIAMRAMARDPAQRFASAGDMHTALLSWLERSSGPLAAVTPATASTGTSIESTVLRSGAESPAGSPPQRRRGLSRAWPLALLLLFLLIGGYLGGRFISQDRGDGLTGIVEGPPGGGLVIDATPSPSPTATAIATQSSTATPTPTITPTSAPTTTPTATPAPPSDTPRAPAATATPRPAPNTPAPVASGSPRDTVAAFYSNVAAGRFDAAYALWSARMKAEFSRQANLDDRFANTASITFDTLFVVDQSATTATVQANFTETYDSGSSNRFVGYWRLVRVDGRWLLDDPTY